MSIPVLKNVDLVCYKRNEGVSFYKSKLFLYSELGMLNEQFDCLLKLVKDFMMESLEMNESVFNMVFSKKFAKLKDEQSIMQFFDAITAIIPNYVFLMHFSVYQTEVLSFSHMLQESEITPTQFKHVGAIVKHSSKCVHMNCKYSSSCAKMKELLRHNEECMMHNCRTPGCSRLSKIVAHLVACKNKNDCQWCSTNINTTKEQKSSE